MKCSDCGNEFEGNFCSKCGKAAYAGKESQKIEAVVGPSMSLKNNSKRHTTSNPLVIALGITVLFLLGVCFFFFDSLVLDGAVFGDPWLLSDNRNEGDYNNKDDNEYETEKQSKVDILKEYLIKNGELKMHKKTASGEYEIYSISYSEEKEDIDFSCITLEGVSESELKNFSYENIKMMTTISLNGESEYSAASWFFLITDDSTYSATANIDKTVFSKSNNTVYDTKITGLVNYNHYSITESLFTNCLASTLEYAQQLLEEEKIGVSLYDLGYTNYK